MKWFFKQKPKVCLHWGFCCGFELIDLTGKLKWPPSSTKGLDKGLDRPNSHPVSIYLVGNIDDPRVSGGNHITRCEGRCGKRRRQNSWLNCGWLKDLFRFFFWLKDLITICKSNSNGVKFEASYQYFTSQSSSQGFLYFYHLCAWQCI